MTESTRAKNSARGSVQTVGDYVEASFEDHRLQRNTHHYISDMLDYYGPETVFEGIFGLEEQLKNIVLFFHAHNTSLERRLLLFVGPQGAGKSYTVDKIKKHLDLYSHTEEGAVWAVKGCPFHQHPFDLIPHDERADLKADHEIRWFPEAIPCPVCEQKLKKHGGWRAVPVERIHISTTGKCGLAKHTPTDLRREDITNFLGNVNFSKLKKIGSTYDPESFDFEGKIIWANRGVLDWTEIFKSRRQLLGLLLELIQSKRIDMANFPTVHVDEIVIGHTNFPEYTVFVNEEIMEPLRGRIFKIEFPYGLDVENEKRILRKGVERTDHLKHQTKHVAEDTLTFAATYAVRTRKDSKGIAGLSPRFFQDVISIAYTQAGECIDLEVLSGAILKMFDHKSHKELNVEKIRELFEKTKEEFLHERIDTFINRLIPRSKQFSEYGQRYYRNYLDAVVRNVRGENLGATEAALIQEVEDLLVVKEKISPKGKAAFESVLVERFEELAGMAYDKNEQLGAVVNEVVFNHVKNFLRLSNKTKRIDDQSREVQRILRETLIKEYGYCKHCAQVLFKVLADHV
ncbi:MAG: hypothetical protein HY814_03985 [Candidatus Riflebacteria bacterium]|nr:hypothetical protein [Candidatus Riflebacteria bacterium]